MAITHLSPFAKLLRRYRADAGLTQEELAERANLSARAISDLERGVKTRPHRVTVDLLADALGLTSPDRALLMAAVPRPPAPTAPGADAFPNPLPAMLRQQTSDTPPASFPPELRRILQGVVDLYVEEDRDKWQVNVTVITVSVADLQAAG